MMIIIISLMNGCDFLCDEDRSAQRLKGCDNSNKNEGKSPHVSRHPVISWDKGSLLVVKLGGTSPGRRSGRWYMDVTRCTNYMPTPKGFGRTDKIRRNTWHYITNSPWKLSLVPSWRMDDWWDFWHDGKKTENSAKFRNGVQKITQ